jgi:hypothetical protein
MRSHLLNVLSFQATVLRICDLKTAEGHFLHGIFCVFWGEQNVSSEGD